MIILLWSQPAEKKLPQKLWMIPTLCPRNQQCRPMLTPSAQDLAQPKAMRRTLNYAKAANTFCKGVSSDKLHPKIALKDRNSNSFFKTGSINQCV